MAINTFSATDFPGVTKPFPASFVTVRGVSGQFTFTEYQTPPNSTTTYILFAINMGLSEVIDIEFFGDGTLVVKVGDPAAAPTYTGTWTPNNGTHDIHFSIDLLGVPTLFIDHVAIPLTFIGNIFSFAAALPVNVVGFFGGAGIPLPLHPRSILFS